MVAKIGVDTAEKELAKEWCVVRSELRGQQVREEVCGDVRRHPLVAARAGAVVTFDLRRIHGGRNEERKKPKDLYKKNER